MLYPGLGVIFPFTVFSLWNALICSFTIQLLHSPRLFKKPYPVAVLCSVASDESDFLRPMNCSPPGYSVHRTLQARILDGLPCPPPGNLPNSGVEPISPASQTGCLSIEPPGKPLSLVTTLHHKKFHSQNT